MLLNLKFIALYTFLILAGLIGAQNPPCTVLSLQDAMDRTTANNHAIKMANQDYRAALSDVEKMKSIYLPQISTAITGSANNMPLHAFGGRLQQGAIEQTDFIPSSLNDPSSLANLQTRFMVRQPILNLNARAMREAVTAKSLAYNQQAIRTEKVLGFHVKEAYLQLQLTHDMKKVLLKAQKTVAANLKLTQDNLDAGYLQKADLLSVEIRVSEIENNLIETENAIQNISDQLSYLMGTDLGTRYKPADQLSYQEETAVLPENLPASRSDIKAIESQVDAHQHLLKAAENASLPRVNAFGSYELNNSLDFSDSQHGYLIGVQAAWDIFKGNENKSSVKKAKIELEKSETQLEQLMAKNQLEFVIAKRQLQESQNKIKLTEKAIEQSEEALRIKTDRYAEGLEKTTDILMAETKVSEKGMEYIEAIYRYRMAQAQLMLILEKE